MVLTVTDDADNPVSRCTVAQPAAKDKDAGSDKDANKVTTSQSERMSPTPPPTPYNVNKDVDSNGAVDKVATSRPVSRIEERSRSPAEDAAYARGGRRSRSTGTNDDGQCVVEVNAPPADPDDDTPGDQAATRGVNTLNFVLAKLTASAEIEVAGAPADIATDPADGSYIGDPERDHDHDHGHGRRGRARRRDQRQGPQA